jgi:hypothetical protein
MISLKEKYWYRNDRMGKWTVSTAFSISNKNKLEKPVHVLSPSWRLTVFLTDGTCPFFKMYEFVPFH